MCTQSCGKGLQARARKCTSPKPANGGRQCPGTAGETRLCNTVGCPGIDNVISPSRFETH